MSDLLRLSTAQIRRVWPFFPLSPNHACSSSNSVPMDTRHRGFALVPQAPGASVSALLCGRGRRQ
jgi:hypothetical protein